MAEQSIDGRVYPIGIQSFQKIIQEEYTYVDKTFFVAKLVKEGQYIFLSRPRRFGKSLLLSTIHAYFEGRRELFKGLAIDRLDMDWTPKPVLHFDLNNGKYDQPHGLEEKLKEHLTQYETIYGLSYDPNINIVTRFERLIRGVHGKAGQKVVILVDEYDKPLLNLEEDSELYEKRQNMLKGFFSNLKSLDDYIEFGMLTGVARFSKVSIFSDLNNLNDISMYEQFQEICGWTEEELTSHFRQGIEELAHKRRETFEQTVKELRNYYDGYLFSEEGTRMYNPYSVMKALYSKIIKPYWFESGTPTFIAKKIQKSGINLQSLDGQTQTYSRLIAVGTNNITALMFQTGYLTISSYDFRRQRYTLCFPNREVEVGFAENLLPLYAPSTEKSDSPFNVERFKDDLYDGKPESFMERLKAVFKSLPGEDHQESTYRAITYLLCVLSGTEAIPERHYYKGRSDLEVLTHDYVYLFEFKYNKSVQEAMDQIYSRDYAGRYGKDDRNVYLIGANYVENKGERELQYRIEEMKR